MSQISYRKKFKQRFSFPRCLQNSNTSQRISFFNPQSEGKKMKFDKPEILNLFRLFCQPISKEILLKYLTDKNVPVTNNFTKTTLVEQVIEYWRNSEHGTRHHHQQHVENIQQQQPYNHTAESLIKISSESFPVNVMARNFASWFYKNLNDNTIQLNDFWSDSTCVIKIIDSSGDVKEDSTITAGLVLNLLFSIKTQFSFYFNPNLSYEGTRGK